MSNQTRILRKELLNPRDGPLLPLARTGRIFVYPRTGFTLKHKLVGVVKGSRLVRQSEETTEPSAIHQEQSADENEDSQNLVPPLQTSSIIHFHTPLID